MTRASPREFYQISTEVERNLRKLQKRLQFGYSTEGTSSTFEATTKALPPPLSSNINISSNHLPNLNPNEMT